MNDAILARVRPRARPESAVPLAPPATYRARYLEGIARGAEPRDPPVLDPAWLAEPQAHPQPSSLAWLFEDGVRCGRGKSLAELERRTGEADLALAVAAEERTRMQAALADEQAKASAAEARLLHVESSRSWRMTAPLRALVRRLRGG
jgi:hypothetical protein